MMTLADIPTVNPVIPRFFRRALLLAVTSLAVAYSSDYLWLRLRVAYPRAGAALGVATIYDATAMKNGEIELFYNQPQSEVCVHALFPHLGHAPCWYLARSPVKQIVFAPAAGGHAADARSRTASRAASRAPAEMRKAHARAPRAWCFARPCAIMRTA